MIDDLWFRYAQSFYSILFRAVFRDAMNIATNSSASFSSGSTSSFLNIQLHIRQSSIFNRQSSIFIHQSSIFNLHKLQKEAVGKIIIFSDGSTMCDHLGLIFFSVQMFLIGGEHRTLQNHKIPLCFLKSHLKPSLCRGPVDTGGERPWPP